MRYVYYLCPKCKDRLIERVENGGQEYSELCCPTCGSEMESVIFADKSAEDTLYQIILNQVRDLYGNRDKCLEVVMQIGRMGKNEALEVLSKEGSVIAEGNLLNTYFNLRRLDEIEDLIDYTVTPDFPARAFTVFCPDCGEEAAHKTEEIGEDELQDGFFCENCGDWVMYDIHRKSWYDKTLYHLRVSLNRVEDKVKKEIVKTLDYDLQDKEVTEDMMTIHGLARDIESLLSLLKTYDVHYEINPPYPHRIIEFKREWTEEDIKQLIAVNPGLMVTVEGE